MRGHRPAVSLPVKAAILVAFCACPPGLTASGVRADNGRHDRTVAAKPPGERSAHRKAETSSGDGVRVLPVSAPTPTPTQTTGPTQPPPIMATRHTVATRHTMAIAICRSPGSVCWMPY